MYIDPNRSNREVDISMLNGKYLHALQATKKLDVGMGLPRKYIVPNVPMYSKNYQFLKKKIVIKIMGHLTMKRCKFCLKRNYLKNGT